MTNDTVMDETTIHKWDDCAFQDHISIPMDLFKLDNNVCGIVVNASKSVFTTEQGNPKDLKLAPIFYEQLYQDLRDRLPYLWCETGIEECAGSETRTLFNSVIDLELTQTTISSLSDDQIRNIFDVSASSPVFLHEGTSISIIERPLDKEWRGFDVADPWAPKIWTMAQLKNTTRNIYAVYAKNHLALPDLPQLQKDCKLLGKDEQEEKLEVSLPTSRIGSNDWAKASSSISAGALPSSYPYVKVAKDDPPLSHTAGPTFLPSASASYTSLTQSHSASSGSHPTPAVYLQDDHEEPDGPTVRPSHNAALTGGPSSSHASPFLLSFSTTSGAPHPSASAHSVMSR